MRDIQNEGQPPIVQFSLAMLLVAMTWVSIVVLGLNTPNRFWSAVNRTVTILTLLTASLIAIYRGGRQQAFAVGFVLFGCSYLFCLHRFEGYAPEFLGQLSGERLYEIIHDGDWGRISIRFHEPDVGKRIAAQRGNAIEIAQTASVTVVAILGGVMASYLRAVDRRNPSEAI